MDRKRVDRRSNHLRAARKIRTVLLHGERCLPRCEQGLPSAETRALLTRLARRPWPRLPPSSDRQGKENRHFADRSTEGGIQTKWFQIVVWSHTSPPQKPLAGLPVVGELPQGAVYRWPRKTPLEEQTSYLHTHVASNASLIAPSTPRCSQRNRKSFKHTHASSVSF